MKETAGFYCYLDGQPDHLTPEHQLARCWSEDMAGHPLFLNKNCQFTGADTLPSELSNTDGITDGFGAMENMAWVRNSITGALHPFWIGEQVRSSLEEMHSGKPASSLPE